MPARLHRTFVPTAVRVVNPMVRGVLGQSSAPCPTGPDSGRHEGVAAIEGRGGTVSRYWWAGAESNCHSRRRGFYRPLGSPPAQPTHAADPPAGVATPRAAASLPVSERLRLRADGDVRQTRARSRSVSGGDEGTRTPDPRDANAVLSQLSYIPTRSCFGGRLRAAPESTIRSASLQLPARRPAVRLLCRAPTGFVSDSALHGR